jgi:hypothetical protein
VGGGGGIRSYILYYVGLYPSILLNLESVMSRNPLGPAPFATGERNQERIYMRFGEEARTITFLKLVMSTNITVYGANLGSEERLHDDRYYHHHVHLPIVLANIP